MLKRTLPVGDASSSSATKEIPNLMFTQIFPATRLDFNFVTKLIKHLLKPISGQGAGMET